MSALHVVYRVDDRDTPSERWSSYSFPYSIYVAGTTLDEVRSELRSAVKFALSDMPDPVSVVEHIEEPAAPGVYVRTAVDQRSLDRLEVAHAMRLSLTIPDRLQHLTETMYQAATGDIVMVACVMSDRLGWVLEQMDTHDVLGVCTFAEPEKSREAVWWSYLAGPQAIEEAGPEPTQGTLGGAGLSAESTIGTFMASLDVHTPGLLVGV